MPKLPKWKRDKIRASEMPTNTKRLLVEGYGKRYLNAQESNLKPAQIVINDGRTKKVISPGDQKKFLKQCLSNPLAYLDSGFVIGVGSTPTDDLAMTFATLFAKKSLEDLQVRVRLHDAQDRLKKVSPTDRSQSGFDWKGTVINNVMYDCTDERAQEVRDLLVSHSGLLRIVVIAGGDPVNFFRQRLRFELDGALYFRGSLRVIKEVG